MTIKDRNFEFKFKEDGQWLWKALTPTAFKIKKVIKEQPQYKVVEKIEEVNKKQFDKALANASRDIIKYLYGGQ